MNNLRTALEQFSQYPVQIAENNVRQTALDGSLADVMNLQDCTTAIATIQSWPGYHPTSLYPLSGLSKAAGVSQIWCKDESTRFNLGSFKALGGAYAVYRQLVQLVQQQMGEAPDLLSLQSGAYRELISHVTVTTATDGNHGRSVAWGAQQFGCKCVIYLHDQVSQQREQQIAAYGARIVRVAGNYDDSVRQVAIDAERHHWLLIADTSYPGYLDIPRDVMHGYSVMVEEVVQQLPPGVLPTHVFVQAGVGSLAAAVFGYLCQRWRTRPMFIVVEPSRSACLYESNRQGQLSQLSGEIETFMACLSAGLPSLLAWQILHSIADFFLTIPDQAAMTCMSVLATGINGDTPIVSGESGCAGAAALLTALTQPHIRQQLHLNAESRILLFNTEGATDPVIYQNALQTASTALQQAHSDTVQLNPLPDNLYINGDRLLQRLDELAQVGATSDGGVCRLALTDSDRAGRDRVVGWMRDLGMSITIDQIGNIIATRAGLEDLPAVMTGSHIDTVATGGRYDGNLGVLAGLEVIQTLNELKIPTRHPLAVAVFTNEEGVRFTPDMMGSLVFQGGLSVEAALGSIGTDGTTVGENLQRIGYAGSFCGRYPLRAFVELHIEQGPILEQQGVTIGVVEGIQGISWREYCVQGVSNHAGTTPMHLRHDAGYAAMAIATYARQLALDMGGNQVATVGSLRLSPNLVNVIPAQAVFTVDLRNTDEVLLQQAEVQLATYVEAIAQTEQVKITSQQLVRLQPTIFDAQLIQLIESTAQGLGYSTRRLPSGAGHDAGMIAALCPTAMIFVPSARGISHNVQEHTSAEDVISGTNVLLHTLLQLSV